MAWEILRRIRVLRLLRPWSRKTCSGYFAGQNLAQGGAKDAHGHFPALRIRWHGVQVKNQS